MRDEGRQGDKQRIPCREREEKPHKRPKRMLCFVAAETAAAAVEEKEAESEVTEETEPEVIEPIAAGTDTPPEGDTDETTESAPKVEVINAAVATESSDVVEEEPTSVAPIASSDVESSPSEAPEAAVSSESEEVTAAEATTPAPVPEVAMETGSGAVARENVTTGTARSDFGGGGMLMCMLCFVSNTKCCCHLKHPPQII